jgi:hypothetical protein
MYSSTRDFPIPKTLAISSLFIVLFNISTFLLDFQRCGEKQ